MLADFGKLGKWCNDFGQLFMKRYFFPHRRDSHPPDSTFAAVNSVNKAPPAPNKPVAVSGSKYAGGIFFCASTPFTLTLTFFSNDSHAVSLAKSRESKSATTASIVKEKCQSCMGK